MITFTTSAPGALLGAFKAAIARESIRTWADDKDGWFSHKATNWKGKAFIRPDVGTTALSFTFLIGHSVPMAERRAVYAYYHGHLIETFINHFAGDFTSGCATPNPTSLDSAKI